MVEDPDVVDRFPEFMNPTELAHLLGLLPTNVRFDVLRGKVPAVRWGKRYFVRRDEALVYRRRLAAVHPERYPYDPSFDPAAVRERLVAWAHEDPANWPWSTQGEALAAAGAKSARERAARRALAKLPGYLDESPVLEDSNPWYL